MTCKIKQSPKLISLMKYCHKLFHGVRELWLDQCFLDHVDGQFLAPLLFLEIYLHAGILFMM